MSESQNSGMRESTPKSTPAAREWLGALGFLTPTPTWALHLSQKSIDGLDASSATSTNSGCR